ncbi:MAG: DNA-binding response regulator [Bacteroides sp.]|nr:DNA-binding response regulator [Bacteroides sp.]
MLIAPLKEVMSIPDLSAPAKLKLELAYRNAQILQDFFIRLQEAYQMEANQRYQIASYTATRIANGVIRSSYELLNASNIELHYDKDKRITTEIWVDKRRIHFVLQSILSNVLHIMEYNGDIWFDIFLNSNAEKEYCVFSIKGKSKTESDHEVTDKDSLRENFLGWDIIQEINRIHGSEMKIEQLTQDESYIELWIPMGKEHWTATENVDFINTDELTEDEFLPELSESMPEAPIVVETAEVLEDLETIPDSKLKLLIIEDNTDIRFYMKIIFSNLYQVFLAENGQEGVEVARRELPNLILTDVMMPVMDGFECLRVLKEDFRTCHIPVIILTALTSDEDIVKGTDLGADDYILKPFNPEVLRAKVKRLMRSRVELKQIYTKLLTSATPSSTHQDEDVADATNTKVEDPLIEKIVELVKANLQNPEFNVKSLADMLFMSQPTLYRKVKQITGFTIIELVRGVRLKEAAELLKTKQYGIQEVSEMVGYNDVPTFRKHFVSLYGTTPSTFAG